MRRDNKILLLAVICAFFCTWLLSGCSRYRNYLRYVTTIPEGTIYRAMYDSSAVTNSVLGFKHISHKYVERNGYFIHEGQKIRKSELKRVKGLRKLNDNCDTVFVRSNGLMDVYYARGRSYLCDYETYVCDNFNCEWKEISDWREYTPSMRETDSVRKEQLGYNKYLDMAILSKDPKLFKYILNIYDHNSEFWVSIKEYIFKGKKLEKVNIVEYQTPMMIYQVKDPNRELLLERIRRIDAGERLWETESLP